MLRWTLASAGMVVSRRFTDSDEVLIHDGRFNETHLLNALGATVLEFVTRESGITVTDIWERLRNPDVQPREIEGYLLALAKIGLVTTAT